MENSTKQSFLSNPLFGFAFYKIIRDNSKKTIDYEFIELNHAFEEMTGLIAKKIIQKRISEVIPPIKSDFFNWIDFYAHISEKNETAEFEQFSDALQRWYRISVYSDKPDYFTIVIFDITQEKKIMEDLLTFSCDVFKSSNSNDVFQNVTDIVLNVSGAKYVALNIFNNNQLEFSTKAVSGVKSHITKISTILGFPIIGKTWTRDFNRENKMMSESIVYYDSLSELTGTVISENIVKFIEFTFNIGKIIILRIFKEQIPIGDFTIVFTKKQVLKNESVLLIYARLVAFILDRNKAFIELLKSEERFNEVALQVKEIIWEIDNNGLFKYINNVCFDVLNYQPSEIIDQKYFPDIVQLEKTNSFSENLSRLLNQQQNINDLECTVLTKSNQEKYFLINAIPIFNELKQCLGYRGAFHDITEDKKIRNQLTRLSYAVDQSPASVVITDLNGNIVYVNKMFIQTSGYSFEEVQGENPRILKSSVGDPNTYKLLWELISSGKQWKGEFINKRKDGQTFLESAIISPVIDTNGKIINYIAIKEDITELKRIEKELEFHRVQLQLIYDNIQVMVALVDRNHKVNYFNKEFLKISGLRETEILGKTICQVFGCQGYQSTQNTPKIGNCSDCLLSKNINEAFELGKHQRDIEYKIYLKNQEKTEKLTFIANTALIGQDESEQVLLCLTNITERKKSEEKLNEQLAFQKLISEISATFVNAPHEKIDDSINFAIEECARFFNIDRSYVFVYNDDSKTIKNTHNWSSEKTKSKHLINDVTTIDQIPWWKFQAKTKKLVYLSDIDQTTGLSISEREQYHFFGIKSLLCIPMVNQFQVIGFVGFDTETKPKIWTNDYISFVGVVVELISRTLSKQFTEQALLLSEEQFQLAVHGNNDGIWDWRIKEEQLYLSPRWKEIIGYNDHELPNRLNTFLNSIHPEDSERVELYMNSYLNGAISNYDIEFRQIHKNGSHIWIHARGEALRDKLGNPYRMAGSHTDITERKNNEFALQRKQILLSAIVDSTDELLRNRCYLDASTNVMKWLGIATGADLVYLYENVFDINKTPISCIKKIEWVSDKFKGLVSSDYENFSYTDVSSLFQGLNDHFSFSSNNIEHLLESTFKNILIRQGVKSVLIFPLFSDDLFWGFVGFHDYQTPREWSNDEFSILRSFSGTLAKAIERKQLEEKLKASLEAAKQATKAKSEFLSTMSHEIRTPLNGVIGFTDLLMSTGLSPIQLQYMESIHLSANTLLDLINDVLDYSKIEAGKLIMNPERTNLLELIEQIVDIVRFSAHKKGLEILLNIPQNCPKYVIIDSVRLRQILINLLSNAIKFTDKGEVELKLEPLKIKDDEFEIIFSVKDTGIGIPTDKINKILDYFTQADASVTRKYGGSGLGLAIATRILGMMNSELVIKSEEGKGSLFSFKLTLKPDEERQNNQIKNSKIKHVLVVDDNFNNRTIVSEMLRIFDISSARASDGLEALAILDVNKNFDLLIVDYHMPDMDGLTMIEIVRNQMNLDCNTLPIIFLHSSSDDRLINEKCKDYNVNLQIVKPLKLTQLKSAIENINGKDTTIIKSTSIELGDQYKKLFEKPFRILIAEDNLTNMLLTKRILSTILPNCYIFEAKDGNIAVQVFMKSEIDLVFMDIHMPEMSGYEATQMIREFEINSRIPIIALTADTSKDEKDNCFEVGMDDYLSKPIVVDDIKKIIIKYLN